MKPITRATIAPALALVGVIALSACQTTTAPAKTDAPKAAAPAEAPKPISPAAAANMGNNCFSCHGPDGRSPGSIPSLHGKNADAIVKAMNDFKSGARPGTVMARHAKGYSDAEIAAIANYISNIK